MAQQGVVFRLGRRPVVEEKDRCTECQEDLEFYNNLDRYFHYLSHHTVLRQRVQEGKGKRRSSEEEERMVEDVRKLGELGELVRRQRILMRKDSQE